MASKFETSFGARLRKFQDAVQYIQQWPVYAPEREEISIANLTALIQNIQKANEKETQMQVQHSAAVATRSGLFNDGPYSVEKLLAPLKAAVTLKYGRLSSQAAEVAAIIRSYRTTQLIKLPADPADPEKQKTISQSQRSYGSRTQFFADIVTTLGGFNGYSSSNPELTVNSLQQKLQAINTANDSVAASLQKVAAMRQDRLQQYQQMATCATLMKDYAASQYGNRSPQYKSLTALGLLR